MAKPPKPGPAPQRPSVAEPLQWKGLDRFAARYGWLVIIAAVLLGLGLRASDLRADPPWDLSWSFAPYTDEGLNNYSARNFALYGTWKVDDFFPFVIYPLVNMLVAIVFKLFGIGFVQVKLVSVLAGALGVLVIYLLMKETAGNVAGLLAGLGVATCYPLVMYSRLGLIETVQILFLLLGGLFWVKGLKRPWLMAFCGFFTAGTVLLVKISAVFIAPVMLVLFAWQLLDVRRDPESRRLFARAVLWFLAGVVVVAGLWFLVVFHPYRSEYVRYVARHSTESPQGHPRNPLLFLVNTFTMGMQAMLYPRLMWVALLGYSLLPFLASGRRPGMRYLLLWMVFGVLLLGWMVYRPPRYEIILIPAMIAAFAAAVGRNLETGTVIPPSRPSILKAALYGIWLWPVTFQLYLYLSELKTYPAPGTEFGILAGTLGAAQVIAFAAYGLLRLLRAGVNLKPCSLRLAVAALLLLLGLRLDFGQFRDWYASRTHNMYEWARELHDRLPEGAVVIGGWAPALMAESRERAVPVADWANMDDPVGRFHPTHVVLSESEGDDSLAAKLGTATLEQAQLLRDYTVTNQIRTQTIFLVGLPRPATDSAPQPAP